MTNTNNFREIWIEGEVEGQALCALINGKQGWLMYLTDADGGDSFHSINLDYHGKENATLEFYLNNGQRDEYPLSWVLPIELINRVLAFIKVKKDHLNLFNGRSINEIFLTYSYNQTSDYNPNRVYAADWPYAA